MLEGPNDAGFLGQEIYGAGFTFRAHLLWDAFACAADREVMVLSVDSYRERPSKATTWEGHFLLFNSRDESVETAISLPIIRPGDEGKVTLASPDGRASTHAIAGGQMLPANLGPCSWATMSVVVNREAK
jgi:hypothetical protein